MNNDAVYFDSLELNILLERLGILLIMKICKQTYSEYKHVIQSSVDVFALV